MNLFPESFVFEGWRICWFSSSGELVVSSHLIRPSTLVFCLAVEPMIVIRLVTSAT